MPESSFDIQMKQLAEGFLKLEKKQKSFVTSLHNEVNGISEKQKADSLKLEEILKAISILDILKPKPQQEIFVECTIQPPPLLNESELKNGNIDLRELNDACERWEELSRANAFPEEYERERQQKRDREAFYNTSRNISGSCGNNSQGQ